MSVIGEINVLSTNWIRNILDRAFTSSNRDTRLEEIIDINKDIDIFSNDKHKIRNPKKIIFSQMS